MNKKMQSSSLIKKQQQHQIKNHNDSNHEIQLTPSMKLLGMQNDDIKHILTFKTKFEATIEQPIHIIEQLCIAKLPQKCLLHNNNYTVYCEQEHKPLCATCLYKNSKHKVHKIIPINQCTDKIRADCENAENSLNQLMGQVYDIIRYVNNGMYSLDNQFNSAIKKIEANYTGLHQNLLIKEQESKNNLKYYREKIKYQYGILSAELRKSALYIQEKIKEQSTFKKQEQLLAKKNVLDTLKLSSKLLENQIKANMSLGDRYLLNFQVFEQIQEMLQSISIKLFRKPDKDTTSKQQKLKRNSRQKSKSTRKIIVNSQLNNRTPPKNKNHLNRTHSPPPIYNNNLNIQNSKQNTIETKVDKMNPRSTNKTNSSPNRTSSPIPKTKRQTKDKSKSRQKNK